MTSKKLKAHIENELSSQTDIEQFLAELDTVEERAIALFQLGTPILATAKRLGISYHASRKIWLTVNPPRLTTKTNAAVEKLWPSEAPEAPSEDETPAKKKAPRISELPTRQAMLEPGKVHRFIATSAQDDTPVHADFLRNIEAYAVYIGASILIGGHTYQLGLFEDHAAEANVYDPLLSPYLCHERVQLTPDVLYLGSANILPTTANPLNGWLTQNHGNHVVVPHSRIALQSIPRLKGQDPRFAISTGTVTKPNYTARAAGQKSIFHHTFGFTIIEIDTDGEVFLRPVSAADDGSFQDLNTYVADGICHGDQRVRAITWGDIHHEQLDHVIAAASFGYDRKTKQNLDNVNVLDGLQPEYQFVHDTLDFRRRNHHGLHDPHTMAAIAQGAQNVEHEVQEASDFIAAICRPWCRTVMIESNHDNALARWLKNPEGASDVENAYYWHEANAAWHKAIRAANDNFNVVEWAMRRANLPDSVEFVGAGQGYQIDGIECGLHGDLGISGSRGSPNQFKRFGVRTSTGHTHTPSISEGAYVAGVSAKLDQGYNRGPTTWAHAHIVQYHNGKRTLLLMSADGRCQAMGDRIPIQKAA
ncbi:hypothetical protein ABE562_04940 [Brucella intermedia]|uniref:A1 protein n=1 Tax=Brucella intermedia GD04153 TaxID=2975438 RepID=A0AA42GYL1_9HYPH|nr:hypothetical protein [Brucella intermedia]MDH0123312.1 hypothetical protein [Brucella intermedia GD04153]